jgi:hypothetical protein
LANGTLVPEYAAAAIRSAIASAINVILIGVAMVSAVWGFQKGNES